MAKEGEVEEVPIEVADDDDDMPELIETDLGRVLPSLIEQNSTPEVPSIAQFSEVGKRKRKSDGGKKEGKDVEMVDAGSSLPAAEKRSKFAKSETRKIAVPPHRYTPLKENWVKIFTPIVKHLRLQIRFNLKSRNVEIRCSDESTDLSNLQKAADFVRAFVLGFDVDDALALIRLDHLFLESFEINDVKPLKGDHLSRAIGRIAGKDGRTKFFIENITKTRIVLAESKIHLLGSYQNIRIARNAISSLIMGEHLSLEIAFRFATLLQLHIHAFFVPRVWQISKSSQRFETRFEGIQAILKCTACVGAKS